MSTHAIIIAPNLARGEYRSVYVHFDGGPRRLGATLLAAAAGFDASAVVEHGDLRSVSLEGGLLGLDVEEEGNPPQPADASTILDPFEGSAAAWAYLYRDGAWYVARRDPRMTDWVRVEELLAALDLAAHFGVEDALKL